MNLLSVRLKCGEQHVGQQTNEKVGKSNDGDKQKVVDDFAQVHLSESPKASAPSKHLLSLNRTCCGFHTSKLEVAKVLMIYGESGSASQWSRQVKMALRHRFGTESGVAKLAPRLYALDMKKNRARIRVKQEDVFLNIQRHAVIWSGIEVIRDRLTV